MSMSHKTHYSCAELAAMKLPGYPTSRQGWEKIIEIESWEFNEHKSRGRGGIRREYLPSSPVQAIIRTHNALQSCIQAREDLNEDARAGRLMGRKLREEHEQREADAKLTRSTAGLAIMARWPKLSNNQVARMLARMEVVQTYNQWLKSQQGKRPAADPLNKGVYKPRKFKPGNKAYNTFAASYSATGGEAVSKEARAVISKTSGRNLRRWVEGFERLGLEGLLDEKDGKHLAGHGKVVDQPEIKEVVVGLLVEFPHVTNKHIEDSLCARFGARFTDVHTPVSVAKNAGLLARPSVDAIGRFREEWEKKHRSVYLALKNPDGWKNEQMLAFGDAAGDVTHPNYRWEMDSTPGDILLLDPDSATGTARYHVLGTIDVWTRRGKLLVSKSSKSIALGSLVRRAILDWGSPERRKADNGADYQSTYLNLIFDAIGCEREDCAPFSGWEKPHIERFFRTFNHDLIEMLPGYIGHNVVQRKELEARASFSERLFEKDGVLEVSMTPAALQKFCDDWCDQVYAHNAHEGLDGMTPFIKTASWDKPIARIKDERALDVLLAPLAGSNKGQFSLQKKGIRINKAWYVSPELARHAVGDRFKVSQDAADMGRVFVFDAQGEFVCIAQNPEFTGVSLAEIASETKAIQRKEMKEQKAELKKVAKNANVKNIAEEIMRRRVEESGQLLLLPQASTTHTTAGLRAAGLAARADEAPKPSPEHEKLMAEARQMYLDQCVPKAPVVQLHPARIPTPLESMTDEQKYALWLEFDATVNGKGVLTEGWQQRFHAGWPKTSAYRAQVAMHQEKGASVL